MTLNRFAMEIDGVYYIAEVKEKAEAWKKYKEAVERGSAAGMLKSEFVNVNTVVQDMWEWRLGTATDSGFLSTQVLEVW